MRICKSSPERPIVDVVEIMLDPALHFLIGFSLSTQAMDLRPAGDARLDVVPAGIERDTLLVLPIVRKRMWPRANQRHVALDDIEQLRQLVDAPATKPGAHLGHP